MSAWLPSVQQVLRLHEKLIARTGGSDGVRSLPLIESALNRAAASFGGVDVWPGIEEKAAAAGCGLVQNHGFVDGNKRIGVAALLLILRRNGVNLAYTQEELIRLGLDMATNCINVQEVALWIKDHRQE